MHIFSPADDFPFTALEVDKASTFVILFFFTISKLWATKVCN